MSPNHRKLTKVSWLCLPLLIGGLATVQATAQPPKGGGGGGSTSVSFNILALDAAPSFAWNITQ